MNTKNIKHNEKKNKIICFKKDLRFELNIEKLDKKIYTIKYLIKKERNSIYKDLFLNILTIFNK